MRYSLSNSEEAELKKLMSADDVDSVLKTVDGFLLDAYYDGEQDGIEKGIVEAQENCDWVDDLIKDGFFDYEISKRAETIGYKKPSIKSERTLEEKRQSRHREAHPDGVYGWEYCARCVEYWGDEL